MSIPHPLVKCKTIAEQKAVVRALADLGYRSMSGRDLETQLKRMDDDAATYLRSPYVGIYVGGQRKLCFGWENEVKERHTLVNSVAHMKAYLTRHGLTLTKAAPPA